MRSVFLACIAFAALIGCNQPNIIEGVNFATDPRILRGVWSGIMEPNSSSRVGETVRMDLQASYVDTLHYTVAGTVKLGNDSPLRLNGAVYGESVERYVQPQVGPFPVRVSANITDANGNLMWTLNCSRWGSIASTGLVYSCLFDGDTIRLWFNLRPVQ